MEKTTETREILDRFVQLAQAQNKYPGLWTKTEISFDAPKERRKARGEGTEMNDVEKNKSRVESFFATPDDIAGAIRREINALSDLLARKNQDYGAAAFTTSPLAPDLDPAATILVRMGDKIKRLENLAVVKETRVDESFEDAVRDLAGYCVLYLALKGE